MLQQSAMSMDAWLHFPGKCIKDPFTVLTPLGTPTKSKRKYARTPKKKIKVKLPRTAPVKSARSRRRDRQALAKAKLKASPRSKAVKRKRGSRTPKPKTSRRHRTPAISKCQKRKKTPHPSKRSGTGSRQPKIKVFLPGSRWFLKTLEENCTVVEKNETGEILVKTDTGHTLWEPVSAFDRERYIPEDDSDSSPLRRPKMKKRIRRASLSEATFKKERRRSTGSPRKTVVRFARETQDGKEVPTLAELSGFWEAYKKSADKRTVSSAKKPAKARKWQSNSDSKARPGGSTAFSPSVPARRSILRSNGRKLSSNKRIRPWNTSGSAHKRIRSNKGSIPVHRGSSIRRWSSGKKKRLASRRRGNVWKDDDWA